MMIAERRKRIEQLQKQLTSEYEALREFVVHTWQVEIFLADPDDDEEDPDEKSETSAYLCLYTAALDSNREGEDYYDGITSGLELPISEKDARNIIKRFKLEKDGRSDGGHEIYIPSPQAV